MATVNTPQGSQKEPGKPAWVLELVALNIWMFGFMCEKCSAVHLVDLLI